MLVATTYIIKQLLPQVELLLVVGVILLVIHYTINSLKDKVIKDMKRKQQRSSFLMFTRVVKYFLFLLVIVLVLWSYYGSFQNAGWVLGIMSVALGFALQKPITGVVMDRYYSQTAI